MNPGTLMRARNNCTLTPSISINMSKHRFDWPDDVYDISPDIEFGCPVILISISNFRLNSASPNISCVAYFVAPECVGWDYGNCYEIL